MRKLILVWWMAISIAEGVDFEAVIAEIELRKRKSEEIEFPFELTEVLAVRKNIFIFACFMVQFWKRNYN